MIYSETSINYEELALFFNQGRTICYPTETLYGLGCKFDLKDTISKISFAKKREESQKYSLLFKDIAIIEEFFFLNSDEAKIIKKFMPGKLSVLLKPKKISLFDNSLVGSNGKVSCRISSHIFVKNLFNIIDFPILSTSANITGQENLFDMDKILLNFKDKIDHFVDFGKIPESLGSTIIDIEENKVGVIREGDIKIEEILEVIQ